MFHSDQWIEQNFVFRRQLQIQSFLILSLTFITVILLKDNVSRMYLRWFYLLPKIDLFMTETKLQFWQEYHKSDIEIFSLTPILCLIVLISTILLIITLITKDGICCVSLTWCHTFPLRLFSFLWGNNLRLCKCYSVNIQLIHLFVTTQTHGLFYWVYCYLLIL